MIFLSISKYYANIKYVYDTSLFRNILLVLLFILTPLLKAQNVNKNIKKQIGEILSFVPKGTKTAILIIDPNKGDTLFSKNAFTPVTPASNTKLFTTSVALQLMGPEYKISTKLYTDDENLTDGVIDGNLYIKGFGNALFTNRDLTALVKNLDSLRIKKISGNIIGDDTYFDNIYSRDDWIVQEKANVTLPPVSALVLNRNKFTLRLSSKRKVRSKLSYSVSPNYSFVKVNMEARITRFRARPRITYHTSDREFDIRVAGGLRRRRYPRYYAIYPHNPPLFAALALREELEKKDIKVLGKAAIGKTPENAIEISDEHVTLENFISETNKNSDNFLAECLFKILGAYYSEEQGNSFYATQAIISFIKEKDIYNVGNSIVDGSGISRFNKITVASIVALLKSVYFNSDIYNDFYNSLSIAGVDGTLKERFNNTTTFRQFYGKTGTLNGVSAISGFLTTNKNTDLIVSIIMEFNKKGARFYRDIQDRIINLLTTEK